MDVVDAEVVAVGRSELAAVVVVAAIMEAVGMVTKAAIMNLMAIRVAIMVAIITVPMVVELTTLMVAWVWVPTNKHLQVMARKAVMVKVVVVDEEEEDATGHTRRTGEEDVI